MSSCSINIQDGSELELAWSNIFIIWYFEYQIILNPGILNTSFKVRDVL